MSERVRIAAFHSLASNAIEIRIMREESGKRTVMKLVEVEDYQEGVYYPPAAVIGNAQELSDMLWTAGVRPSQSNQSQGAFEAQGKHLDDMRAIAFDRLKIKHTDGQ